MRRFASLFLVMIAVSSTGQTAPRVADPLTPAEIERAGTAAMTAAAARFGTRERLELVSVELVNIKSVNASRDRRALQPDQVGRHALVTMFHYGRNEGLSVFVDVRAATAAASGETRLPSHAVPLSRNEIQRAASLALENASVRRAVGADQVRYVIEGRRESAGGAVEALRMISSVPADPCSVDRCADLFFRRRDGYVSGLRVTVNLTRGTVNVEQREAVAR